MRIRTAVLVVVCLHPILSLAEDDPFDFSPPHSISTRVGADQQGATSASLGFSASLPKGYGAFGSIRSSQVDVGAEASRTRGWNVGIGSDALDPLAFSLAADSSESPGEFQDRGVDAQILISPTTGWFSQVTAMVGAGARRFEFAKTSIPAAPATSVTVSSNSVSLGATWYASKRWVFGGEFERRFYPSQIKDLDRPVVTLLVPSDTLGYAFSIPETYSRAFATYSPSTMKRLKPTFELSVSNSKSAVDGAALGTLALEIGASLTRRWRLNLGGFSARNLVGAASEGSVLGVSTGIRYSWR